MTKDEAMKLAEQAGMRTITYEHDDPTYFTDQLDIEKFAALIRQYENEACAKACEQLPIPNEVFGAHHDYLEGKRMAVFQCADTIRARMK